MGRRVADRPAIEQEPTTPLLDLLRRRGVQVSEIRRSDYLHVSDLLHKCVRRIAICKKNGITAHAPPISLSQLLTFEQGDGIHDGVKNWLKEASPDSLYGIWSCPCGTTKHEQWFTFDEIDHEETCEACGKHIDQYHEIELRDEELRVVGHPDVVLRRSGSILLISELKSIKHEDWVELVRPQPLHIMQVIAYWHLAKRKGLPVSEYVSIAYFTKKQVQKEYPGKEFVLRAEEYVPRVLAYIETAESYAAFLAGGDYPARTYCKSFTDSNAKICNVRSICFDS